MFQRLEAEFHRLEVGMQRLENHYQQWPSGVATWQILGDRLSPLHGALGVIVLYMPRNHNLQRDYLGSLTYEL
jgi:hypothetical protein